jgi:hypothetical protein
MIFRFPDRPTSAYDDDWADIPASGPLPQWLGGIIIPVALLAYGISRIVVRHAILGGRIPIDLHGPTAVALGIASLSLGVFLHCHYFWGNLYHLSAAAVLGKIVALIGFIISVGYIIVQVGIFG